MAKIHGKDAVFYLKQFDMSGESSSFTVDMSIDSAEITAFGNAHKTFVEGPGEYSVSVDSFFDGASDKMDDEDFAMIGAGTSIFSIYPNADAEGSIGYAGQEFMVGHPIAVPIGGAVTMSCSFNGSGILSRPMVIEKLTTTTAGANNGSSHDFGSAGSDILSAYMHVTAYSGFSSVAVKIQQSSDNNVSDAWADLVSFTNATSTTSERVQTGAAGERYLRCVVTPSGTGSVTLVVGADNK